MGHVRFVVERQPRPSVYQVVLKTVIIQKSPSLGKETAHLVSRVVCRVEERVEPVVMTGSAIDDVKRSRRVIEAIRIERICGVLLATTSSSGVTHNSSLACSAGRRGRGRA